MIRPVGCCASSLALSGLATFAAFVCSASLAGAQVKLRPLKPPSAALKRHAVPTKFTAADLIKRLEATATGRQALARAGVRTAAPAAGGSGSTSAGWPSTFQITADASRVTSSQTIGQHSVAMANTYFPVSVSPDDAGQMMVEAQGSSDFSTMWLANFNPLPPGWYAVSFEVRLEDSEQPQGIITFGDSPYDGLAGHMSTVTCSWGQPDVQQNDVCIGAVQITEQKTFWTGLILISGTMRFLGVTVAKIS